jgi:hypothetical protein
MLVAASPLRIDGAGTRRTVSRLRDGYRETVAVRRKVARRMWMGWWWADPVAALAMSPMIGREEQRKEATGGSVDPLFPVFLENSQVRDNLGRPPAATDCQSFVGRLADRRSSRQRVPSPAGDGTCHLLSPRLPVTGTSARVRHGDDHPGAGGGDARRKAAAGIHRHDRDRLVDDLSRR